MRERWFTLTTDSLVNPNCQHVSLLLIFVNIKIFKYSFSALYDLKNVFFGGDKYFFDVIQTTQICFGCYLSPTKIRISLWSFWNVFEHLYCFDRCIFTNSSSQKKKIWFIPFRFHGSYNCNITHLKLQIIFQCDRLWSSRRSQRSREAYSATMQNHFER